jgi:hypothetical protein
MCYQVSGSMLMLQSIAGKVLPSALVTRISSILLSRYRKLMPVKSQSVQQQSLHMLVFIIFILARGRYSFLATVIYSSGRIKDSRLTLLNKPIEMHIL